MDTVHGVPGAGMPSETAMAVCCMTMGGVLERFPRLKVCFAHGGGAFPYTLGRISHGHAVRPDLCAVENTISPHRARMCNVYLLHTQRSTLDRSGLTHLCMTKRLSSTC
jgi:predicted TIM-barrel fold metal-dependent hydrolase